MKKCLLLLALVFSSLFASAQIDKIVGEWYTVDDETGAVKALVDIYKGDNGLYYGKIIKLFAADANKKNLGLVVVKDMKEKKGELTGGKIYDPKSGNTYHATIKYNSKKNCLVLRGSIDKYGLIGRSQTWVK